MIWEKKTQNFKSFAGLDSECIFYVKFSRKLVEKYQSVLPDRYILLVFAIVHHMSTVTHENTQMINNRIRCGNIVFMYIVQIHIYSYTCITYIILTFHVINIVYCCNVQLVVFYFFLNKEHELLNLNDPRASTIISNTDII